MGKTMKQVQDDLAMIARKAELDTKGVVKKNVGQDITWCSKENCPHKDCFRNQVNRKEKIYSVGDIIDCAYFKEDEIEVGDYVRTRGIIAQITDIRYIPEEGNLYYFNYYRTDLFSTYKLEGSVWFGQITKHSKNLIDLIEVGDFVNGKEIKEVVDYDDFKKICFDGDREDVIYSYDYCSIKTILTHEQYEANAFKVGEVNE